ncbi:MAG: 50S ribosomal protein L18 [Flavobacteriales bacterium]|nr:50S ribosomal protein L18 [Flavobacteriales bacterium]
MALTKNERRIRVKRRIRKVIKGSAECPRLAVFRSNKNIYSQLIDDVNGVTLASASTKTTKGAEKGTASEKAVAVGKSIAEKAIKAGISAVRFDRGGYLYHGRIKSLAEGAREGGLKF